MNNKQRKTEFSLNNIAIAPRLLLLFLVPVAVLAIVGGMAIKALNQNGHSLVDLRYRIENINRYEQLINQINTDYRQTLIGVENGTLTWDEGKQRLLKANQSIKSSFADYRKQFTAEKYIGNQQVDAVLKNMERFKVALDNGQRLLKSENHAWLELFITNDLNVVLEPLVNSLKTQKDMDISASREAFDNAKNSTTHSLNIAMLAVILGLGIAIVLGYLIYRSFVLPARSLAQTVEDISHGEYTKRAKVYGNDELAGLAVALNQLLDERISVLATADKEHKILNKSVMGLLHAVSELSDRKLFARATVTEDATGPLADAINQFAEDTGDVLKQVQDISDVVATSSEEVNQHAESVNEIAVLEQMEAKQTAEELNSVVQNLEQIAEATLYMNQVADATTSSTEAASKSVSHSLESIQDIREHTQETGKRIKRLGERSQEITHIVEIINSISERTTILALNASMQAAAAGEAGKGFSVVAEEIQRLAENSRESTSQISALIRNIQIETNEAIRTMDQTIEQVISGSKLAETAEKQMQEAQKTTFSLISKVDQIFQASQQQAERGRVLQKRAKQIVKATLETGKRLRAQSELTVSMKDYTQQLLKSVKIFHLAP